MTFSPLAYLCAGLAFLCLILGSGWYGENAAHNVTKATFAAEKATAAREFAEAARAKEQQWAQRIAETDAKHQQELEDARETGERVAADLRSGAARLHRRWEACQATGQRVSEATAGSRQSDAGADDRAESAGRAIAAARACDAQVRALQDVLRKISQ